ncbi:hypothetical protein C2845_PM09G09340 [Panicum miliaceum]|uniref:Uncharacterized protein n=1 Tax=Panicum miliaceum TaxID=4540 RepID=A0A3L6S093_PANMI|nr:hypothetical protein C2845_PM09G09340 [Panicum miliaceum]
MKTDRTERPTQGDGQGGNNFKAGSSKQGGYKGTQADLKSWPTLRKNGSAPGKLFTSASMNTTSKQQGKCSDGEKSYEHELEEIHPEEDVIPAATYEPTNDMEKGDSEDDSDDYVNQVRKVLGDTSGGFRDKDSQWRVEHVTGLDGGSITHTIFENAKLHSSSVRISEIQSEKVPSLEVCSSMKDTFLVGENSAHMAPVDENSQLLGVDGSVTLGKSVPIEKSDVVNNNSHAEVLDFNTLESLNRCDMMMKMREERRTSARLQQNMMNDIVKNQDKSSKKRSVEGNTLPTSNAFSSLDDNMIADLSLNMSVNINDKHFESLNVIRDLELARYAINSKQQTAHPQTQPDTAIGLSQNEMDPGQNLLEWLESEQSEDDGFTIVTPKRIRKAVKRLSISGKKPSKGRSKENPCQKKEGEGL